MPLASCQSLCLICLHCVIALSFQHTLAFCSINVCELGAGMREAYLPATTAALSCLAWQLLSTRSPSLVPHPFVALLTCRDSSAKRKQAKTGRSRGRQVYLGGFSSEVEAARA